MLSNEKNPMFRLQNLIKTKQEQKRQLFREMAGALSNLDREFESNFRSLQIQLQDNLRRLSERAPGCVGEAGFNSESYQNLLSEQGQLEEEFARQSELLKNAYEKQREKVRLDCRVRCAHLEGTTALPDCPSNCSACPATTKKPGDLNT